jgi:release factor glutamine methyltransferase
MMMKTVREILPQAALYLQNKGISDARRSAEEIIAFVLLCKRLDLYLNHDLPLKEEELERVRQLMKKRGQKTPLDYVLGVCDFYGCKLKITPDVLIPRPETEILVDLAVKRLQKEELQGKVLWDLCCGSGCIGLAMKKSFPDLTVVLSDVSEAALEVAKENARQNGLDVRFLQGDFLAPFGPEKADFVISNPPYVSEVEYGQISSEVRDFEPKGALVARQNGLEFYERIASELPVKLRKGGKVFLEMGRAQGKALTSIFSSPLWTHKQLLQDWAGHDRFFFLEIE